MTTGLKLVDTRRRLAETELHSHSIRCTETQFLSTIRNNERA
jgi:hypothetical protein